jgi:chromosome segregation ATPase
MVSSDPMKLEMFGGNKNELEKINRDQSIEIYDLKQEIEKLRHENSRIDGERSIHKEAVKKLQKNLDDLQEKLNDLQDKFDVQNERLYNVSYEKSYIDDERVRKIQEVEKNQAIIDKLKEENQDLQRRLTRMRHLHSVRHADSIAEGK